MAERLMFLDTDAPHFRALPLELRESNPLGIPRRVDGVLRLPGAPVN